MPFTTAISQFMASTIAFKNLSVFFSFFPDFFFFFLQTQHVNHQVDQKDIFNLSYNPDQEVEKDDDGQRIYNLYLRVTQEGGTGDSTKWINTTAFTIDKFLDQAKAIESSEGQNVINFKINYAERYNADTTACVWGATDVFTLRFTN